MTLSLSGIGVSRGVAIGKAHVLQRGQLEIPEYVLPKRHLREEVARFKTAVDVARQQLKDVRQHIPEHTPADIASFIDTHLLMLDDSTLSSAPIDIIMAQQCNAEWALKQQRDALVSIFDEMDDAYLRTRKDDVDHVVSRIQRVLLNQSQPHAVELGHRLKDCVLVADDLTPADTVLIQHYGIAGFITEYGGPTSHTSILARSLRVPALVGVHHARRYLNDGEEVVIDGESGVVLADADERTLKYYRRRQREEKKRLSALRLLKGEPAITLDDQQVTLHANIELPEDIAAVKRVAAEGIGLYRTEFLFMNRPDTPDEDEQFRAYVKVLNSLKGAPVTIRTFDLGADKQVDGAGPSRPLGSNPALGLRAVRLCLKDPGLFMPQLRAILRASAYGPVKLMVPMLSSLGELDQVMELVGEAKRQLIQEGYKFDNDIPIGGMIEVPAAAMVADHFARRMDFLSIGTNDLIQYTLAIDRIDDEVSYLYDPMHPAVLQLISRVIKAGRKAGIPVSMCGEMAGDPLFTRLLLGLGLRAFSMHPSALLEIKHIVNTSDVSTLTRTSKRILRSASQSEINRLLNKLNTEPD